MSTESGSAGATQEWVDRRDLRRTAARPRVVQLLFSTAPYVVVGAERY